jgi:RimJ/RimL family protein N-acetyltransferase
MTVFVETERLILRSYHEADREPFAVLNGDPRVGDWVAGALDRAGSDALMDRITGQIQSDGMGFWAAERKTDSRLVGFVGLQRMKPGLPTPGAAEIGWRLIPEVWGEGLATEGALGAVRHAFENLGEPRVVAITADSNLRSQAVMRKIGMSERQDLAFDHPVLAEGHPLRRHVFFEIARS